MSNETLRMILNAAEFPFSYEQVGRSVTRPVDQNNRMPGAFFGAVENAEFGVPQLVYGENILPFAKGIFSVSMTQAVSAISPATSICDQAITLRDASENQFTFVPAKGLNYVLDPTTLIWSSVNPFSFANNLVTRAYVQGRTFVCYEKDRIIEYVGGVFNTIALTFPPGITISNVRGIGAASNYLLLFTDLSIYWCSPLNILNFSDMDAGAGQQIPLDIKGQITSILPISGGFIVYTTKNAISARYTGNSNGPFVFKEIKNCGGVASWERVTADANAEGHYIWSTYGLQLVDLDKAVTLHPGLTDFLVGNQFQTWDKVGKQVVISAIAGAYSVKLTYLAGRYLMVSYGQGRNDFDAAFVLDTSLDRWGHLVINHADTYMYVYPSTAGDYFYSQLSSFYADLGEDTYSDLGVTRLIVSPPKRGIAFLKNDGSVYILNTDFNQSNANGVALFGRIQQVHDKVVTITNVDIDGLKDSPAYTVSLLGSVLGLRRDLISSAPLTDSVGDFKRFNPRVTGKNFDVSVEGNFKIASMLVDVANHGFR